MKVHISLVGGQPVPVYHGIVATQPDHVVLVYSKNTADVLNRLKEVLTIPVESFLLHPTDPHEILQAAQALAKRFAGDNIVVNISSGLKSWSHLFGITFQPLPNAHVVYMDQNNVLWDYNTMTAKDDYQFDMDTLFKLYGNPLNRYTRFQDYTEEDLKALPVIESLRKHNFKHFNELTAILTKERESQLTHPQGAFSTADNKSFIEWDWKGHWTRIALFNFKWGVREETIQSPHAKELLFHSGWFEFKVAQMLSHWKYAKEIRLNCIFPLRTAKTPSPFDAKNEIDIIVNTGRKLLFVECKTNIASSNEIDKFKNAVKNYGGMGSKALFVTENKMTDIQKEKCRESAIIPFSLAESNPNKEQELFNLLNSHLMTINS